MNPLAIICSLAATPFTLGTAILTFNAHPTPTDPSAVQYTGSTSVAFGNTLNLTSYVAHSPVSGTDPVAVNNYLNSGAAATITATATNGWLTNQTVSIALGQTAGTNTFDDGMRIVYNGVTLIDFDQPDYQSNADITGHFGTNNTFWRPWFAGANPTVEIKNGSTHLWATTSKLFNGVAAGTVIDLLPLFLPTSDAIVNTISNVSFVGGDTVQVYNRNHAGAWSLAGSQITASADYVPEPSTFVFIALGSMALLFHRKARRDS